MSTDGPRDVLAELSETHHALEAEAKRHNELKAENERNRRELRLAEGRVVKLARALAHAVEWMSEDGCDCGVGEAGTCGLCEAERVLSEVAGGEE